MVQSTLSQCINANSAPEVMEDLTIFAEKNGYSEEYEVEELKRQVSSQGYEQITYRESLLITAYKAKYGKIPPWNKIHGKNHIFTSGELAIGGDLLTAMTDSSYNFFVARCNLFELAAETMPQPYEEVLHVARMNTVHFGMPHELALQKIHDVLNYRQKMKADGYLSQTPQI